MVTSPQIPTVERLADLFWLLAHDERGTPRIGREHLAVGLAASVLGEVLTQSSAMVTANGELVADPVVAHVLNDLVLARTVQQPLVWIEWLARNECERSERDVVSRLVDAGLLVRSRRTLVPVNPLTAFAPARALIRAVAADSTVSDPVRLLAGLCLYCGLSGLVAADGSDVVRPLQLVAMRLPPRLFGVVAAADEAVNRLALRRR